MQEELSQKLKLIKIIVKLKLSSRIETQIYVLEKRSISYGLFLIFFIKKVSTTCLIFILTCSCEETDTGTLVKYFREKSEENFFPIQKILSSSFWLRLLGANQNIGFFFTKSKKNRPSKEGINFCQACENLFSHIMIFYIFVYVFWI